VAEQPADDREVAQPRDPFQRRPLVVADQAGQHVRLAVAKADGRLDVACAERRQVLVADAREVAHFELEAQRDVVVGAAADLVLTPICGR
jgi:hypothetical protein